MMPAVTMLFSKPTREEVSIRISTGIRGPRPISRLTPVRFPSGMRTRRLRFSAVPTTCSRISAERALMRPMSALTAVVHMMFHFTIPVQAGTALVIISGVALGPEAGFLVGALARFVCNFYLTQGAWTPWQMFCWGILGFLAGLAFNKANIEALKSRRFNFVAGPIVAMVFAFIAAYVSFLIWPGKDDSFLGWRLYAFGAGGLIVALILQRKRLPIDGVTLALFTFFVTFIIYGGVMNVAAMITSAAAYGGDPVHTDTLRSLYIAGVAYDLAHAGSAALFIFLFGETLIGKLERIKIKYGIYR